MSITVTNDEQVAGLDLRRRFTVDEYRKMAEVGILDGQSKTELIAGEIFKMLPTGRPHRDCVSAFAELLFGHLPKEQWAVFIESTVEMEPENAPEPDIFVLHGSRMTFYQRDPLPEEYAYLIEISDSTLHVDRQRKLPLYAQFGVPEYWIVNLQNRSLEVYRVPAKDLESGRGYYKEKTIFAEGDLVSMTFDGLKPLEFRLSELLPGRSG